MNHLALVNPATGEIHEGPSYSDLTEQVRDLEDRLAGYKATCDKQAREIGSLRRRITEDEDPTTHPQGAEIVALIAWWQKHCHHDKAKVSADRVKLIRSRLKDGYSPEQIALAIDGLASAPFVVNAQRRAEGKESQRYDQLKHALNGGQDLERFANIGYLARKSGRITWPKWGESC